MNISTQPSGNERLMALKNNPMVDLKQTSTLIGVPRSTLNGWIRRGVLRTVRFGRGKRYVSLAEIERVRNGE
jgi:predicted site-specific integrase-resolvase